MQYRNNSINGDEIFLFSPTLNTLGTLGTLGTSSTLGTFIDNNY